MPTLSLRSVGRSFLLEGIPDSGLDGSRLLDDLAATHGAAVVSMGSPPGEPVQAILVDCRAAGWEPLQEEILNAVRSQGASYAAWADESLVAGSRVATLHVH